jgi:hypothetical protein
VSAVGAAAPQVPPEPGHGDSVTSSAAPRSGADGELVDVVAV